MIHYFINTFIATTVIKFKVTVHIIDIFKIDIFGSFTVSIVHYGYDQFLTAELQTAELNNFTFFIVPSTIQAIYLRDFVQSQVKVQLNLNYSKL